jgi:VanZ family protein
MKIKANSPVLLSWAPALTIMGALFYASSLPGDRIHLPLFPFSDKLVHFLVYAVLGAAIALRFDLRRRLTGLPADLRESAVDLKGLAAGMIYGISDEIHQLFVPMRLFGAGDLAADFLGVAAGYLAYRKLLRSAVPAGAG